jgi:hypothetical protein
MARSFWPWRIIIGGQVIGPVVRVDKTGHEKDHNDPL